MPLILTLTTPRDRQARTIQNDRVEAVVLNLGELTLLDLSITADVTTSDAATVVRTVTLLEGPQFVAQIPTAPERIATVRSLFDEVVGMTCECTVTPVVT